GQNLVGRGGNPDLLALLDAKAIEELDLGTTALEHVLASRRAMFTTARPVGFGQTVLVNFLGCGRVTLARTGDRLRVHVADFVKGVAERLADTDGLAAEPGRKMTNRVVLDHVAGDQPGAGRQPVAHDVGNELRPAFPPRMLCYHRAVGRTDELADLFRPVGDAAMHLADAEYGVARARFARGAAHLTRCVQFDGDGAGDRAQRLAPTDDAGDGFLV